MPARAIDTGIWGEEGFAAASTLAKALYVRLITGDDTGSAGALKTRLKRLAADLEGDSEDVTLEQLEGALAELVAAGLVRTYDDGWIWLPKFVHWQAHSEGFLVSAERQAAECPDSLERAIRRAVARKRTALGSRADAARTRKKPVSRRNGEAPPEATPEAPPKAPRTIRRARGQGKGSGALTPDPPPSSPPDPEPQRSAATSSELSPAAQTRPPEVEGHTNGRRLVEPDGDPVPVGRELLLSVVKSPAARAALERGGAG
ncbi:hypothetical protein [Miltoncostaea oceani]|uniref:hypothetical protein n=1 Tax=Miltoncostaea oceani TaxID=2843216 RepID=UPI001C3D1B2D|nr:hypothetical protein [Miltoncostaea oceani]